jgi:type II secretory pathway pseudopilin PulG
VLSHVRRRAQAARASGDTGVTLIELIVSMTLTVVLGAMTLTLFLQISDAASGTTDRTINASSARNAIQSWTSYLRVADGPMPGSSLNRLEWITSGDLMFHANLYNRPTSVGGIASTGATTMVWLRIDTKGALVEEQFLGAAPAGSDPTVCRVLVAKATAPGLFTPYDRASPPSAMTGQGLGSAPTGSAGCQKLPVTVPSLQSHPNALAVANLQNVGTVVIDFLVSDTKNSHAFEYNSQATLPILGGSL